MILEAVEPLENTNRQDKFWLGKRSPKMLPRKWSSPVIGAHMFFRLSLQDRWLFTTLATSVFELFHLRVHDYTLSDPSLE